MNNVFYDNEEQDTLLIPVEDEQYTVITDGNKDSVVAIDDTQQTETVLIPSATQTLLAIDSGVAAPKQAAPVGDYVTIKTKQTITGDKDFTGELTHNGIPVATVEDFDTSNLVDLDSYQLIDGVKVFNEQFGIRNKSNGEINLIKHINNNFLITENNGTNILNIDEQLKSMYLYNKKIATEEYVNDKAMEGGSGTVINVGGVEVSTLNFSSDPQTQLDNKVDTQYIDENLPIIVDNLVSNKGFIDKNVDNLANYYTKTDVDNTFYDKVEVDQRIPTSLSHLTDDVGYLTQETDPTVPDWAKQPNKPEYNYSEIKNKPTGVLSLWDKNPQHAIVEFDGTADKTFEIDVPGLEFEINANKDYIINLQNDVGQISDTIVDLTGKVNNKVDTSTLKSYYTSSQTDSLLNDKATAVVTEAKGYTDTKISDLIGGAPGTLDTLKEIADAFAEDQEVLDALETAIGKKVDKVDGYGLSKNDYTDKDKAKLDNIAEGAEVNVQADWTVNDNTSDAYIKNKPDIPSIAGLASETYVNTQVNTLQGKIDLKADKEDLIDYATNEDLNKVAENILDNIPDISGLASENYVTSVANVLHERINGKQDKITDLATIRSGASAGATAVQPSALESQVSALQGKIDAKYTKPASGIPASDLAETYDTVTSVNNKTTTTLNNAKSYTDTKIGELIGSAPETLDTLQEVAKAIKDNADVVAGLNSAIGTKADKTTVDSLEVQVNTNAAAISNTYTKTEVGTILEGYATNNDLAGKVDKTTTINSKPLSSNITLSASDVGALPNTTVVPKLYNDYGENEDGAVSQLVTTALYYEVAEAFNIYDGKVNAKYTKPSTGIPKTDLASDVQTSLGKADSALQSIPAEYITETELNAKGYASQSDLDETNTNVLANTTAINSRYTNSQIDNFFLGQTNLRLALEEKVNTNTTSISNLDNNKADKTDVQSRYNTLSTNKADKTELESAVTELNNTIDDVRELIGESQGTVVRFGETPQPEVIFTSNPQDQIDALNEKTDDLVGKTYYVIDDDYGYKYSRGEIFNDYDLNVASGVYSHAEGGQTDATGQYSHAEGFNSLASGNYSHAEGNSTASGLYAHAEGKGTTASADFSHAQGLNTTASHQASSAIGSNTKTGRECQSVAGVWNVGKSDTLFEVGNGYWDDVYGQVVNQNAFEVQEDGTLYTQNGTITDGTNSVSLGNVATKDEIPTNYVTTDTEQTITGSKTLNAPLIVTGGDASSGVGNIQLDTDGNIIAKGTNSTLLGFGNGNLLAGHSSYPLLLRGKNTRPTYNGANMALSSDASNPNLIINGDFRINQRGNTTYSSSGYTVDRWQNSNNYGTLTKSSNYITFSASGGTAYLVQRIEDSGNLVGKTVTLSVCLSDDTIYSATETLQAVANSYATIFFEWGNVRIYYYSATGYFAPTIHITDGNSVSVKWVKLELGSVATPYCVIPYAQELALCQRYYQKFSTSSSDSIFIATGIASTTSNVYVPLTYQRMRNVKPTITYGNYDVYGNGTGYTATAVSVYSKTNEGNCVLLSVTSSGLTKGYPYFFRLNKSGYLTLDAEI